MAYRVWLSTLCASLTWWKSQPTTTVWPTRASAYTVPSSTLGVLSTGFAETTAGWYWSARAGMVAAAHTPAAATRDATSRPRRMVQLLGGGDYGTPCPGATGPTRYRATPAVTRAATPRRC